MTSNIIYIVMKDDRATNFYNLEHLFGEPGALCFPGPRDIAVERLRLLGNTTVRPTPLLPTRLLRRQNANTATARFGQHFLPGAAGIFFPPVPFFVVEEGSEEEEMEEEMEL